MRELYFERLFYIANLIGQEKGVLTLTLYFFTQAVGVAVARTKQSQRSCPPKTFSKKKTSPSFIHSGWERLQIHYSHFPERVEF